MKTKQLQKKNELPGRYKRNMNTKISIMTESYRVQVSGDINSVYKALVKRGTK